MNVERPGRPIWLASTYIHQNAVFLLCFSLEFKELSPLFSPEGTGGKVGAGVGGGVIEDGVQSHARSNTMMRLVAEVAPATDTKSVVLECVMATTSPAQADAWSPSLVVVG